MIADITDKVTDAGPACRLVAAGHDDESVHGAGDSDIQAVIVVGEVRDIIVDRG